MNLPNDTAMAAMQANPIQSYLFGGQFSPLFYVTGVALKFYFGTPRPDDQRWKNATDSSVH
jgi:hypothetical protein